MTVLNHWPSDIYSRADLLSRALRTSARTSLKSFVLYTMPEYDLQPHHDLMMSAIQQEIERPDGRLYIGMPPRHGKSETGTIRTIAWHIGCWPWKQVVLLCYGSELAAEFSRRIRAMVRDDRLYRHVFPHVGLDPERAKLLDWKTTAGGGLKSLGVQGGITGHGADFMVIDDPHKEGDAESLTTLDQIYDWYVTAARTRLSPGASIVFIMTRWHMLDLAGRLLDAKDSDQWRQIVLPALAEDGDLLGREPGQALWPGRFDRANLLAIKALNDRYFQALYQNNPRGADDLMFDVSRVEWIDAEPGESAFWTCDLATSRLETADYTVLARWKYDKDRLFLLQNYRERETFAAVRRRLLEISEKYPDDKIVFPKEVLELLMLKDLGREVGAGRLKEVSMKGDKVQKAIPVSTLVANDRFVATPSKENDYFVSELGLFPQGRFDDCVDAAAVAAHWVGVPREFEFFMGGGAS